MRSPVTRIALAALSLAACGSNPAGPTLTPKPAPTEVSEPRESPGKHPCIENTDGTYYCYDLPPAPECPQEDPTIPDDIVFCPQRK